jgi:hypothetical protein
MDAHDEMITSLKGDDPSSEVEPSQTCYQCEQPAKYLFADGRGKCCTRVTPEEVTGWP